MKRASAVEKRKIDWYFAHVNGKVAVPKIKLPRTNAGRAAEENNVEARHRDAWRRNLRSYFAAALLGFFLFEAPAFAEAISSDVKAKAAAKAAQKAAMAKKSESVYPKEAKKSEKLISGTFVSVHQGRIAIEFGESEELGAEQMLIPVADGLKLSNASSLKDLKYGDFVEVKFMQVQLPSKIKDQAPSILGTQALEIRLVETAAERAAKAAASAPMAGAPA